jgi:hypothetical protein
VLRLRKKIYWLHRQLFFIYAVNGTRRNKETIFASTSGRASRDGMAGDLERTSGLPVEKFRAEEQTWRVRAQIDGRSKILCFYWHMLQIGIIARGYSTNSEKIVVLQIQIQERNEKIAIL